MTCRRPRSALLVTVAAIAACQPPMARPLPPSLSLTPCAASSSGLPDWTEDADRETLDRIAAFYKPFLQFHALEAHYPTVPFFTALDGIDNGGDPAADFLDLEEIAPIELSAKGDTLASWSILRALYERLPDRQRPGAAFYRIRRLGDDDRSDLWRFLRSDPQAWRRSGMEELMGHPSGVEESTELISIEYYFYYVSDTGLQGHPQDIEFVFVFVPAENARRCGFEVVVGAGHSSREPNNVHVGVGRGAGTRNTEILVELGGHASAPDVEPLRVFEPGVDVNWHTSRIWGTRDVLAVSGSGFAGRYDPVMTFTRDLRADQQRWNDSTRLVPVEALERLYARLPGGDSARTAPVDPADPALRAAFDTVHHYLRRPTSYPDSAALARMALWNRGVCCTYNKTGVRVAYETSKHQPWRHDHYRADPAEILKAHLLRPSTGAIRSWSDPLAFLGLGYRTRAGGPRVALVSYVIPTPRAMPVSVPGFLTASLGRDFGAPESVDWLLGLTYDNSYSEYVTWYGELALVRQTKPTDYRMRFGAGLSILAMTKDWPIFDGLRFRLGPELEVHHLRAVDVRWQWAVAVH